MRCAPARPVRALCEPVAQLLSKNMTCARPRCNATPSKHFLHTSHCALHTSHFTLLHAGKLLVSERSLLSLLHKKHWAQKAYAHRSLRHIYTEKPLHSTLHQKACTKHLPVLLCTTKLAQSTPQYYFVLQGLHRVLPSTTLYYKACRKYSPILHCNTKLARSTSQYYFVQQSLHKARPGTTLYYKACTKHFPALLCTTKLAQARPSTTFYYKVCTEQFPVILRTTKSHFVLHSLHRVLPSTTLCYKDCT